MGASRLESDDKQAATASSGEIKHRRRAATTRHDVRQRGGQHTRLDEPRAMTGCGRAPAGSSSNSSSGSSMAPEYSAAAMGPEGQVASPECPVDSPHPEMMTGRQAVTRAH